MLLAATYVYFFTDWFNQETIQIIPQVRPTRASKIPHDPKSPAVYPVSFLLRGKYKLTSVKVVAAEESATNKYARALWHLISDSNSVPTKSFEYGQAIKGMKPAVPSAVPDALEPDIPYVLVIEAGKIKGRTNFFTKELAQARPQ
jgi:hypothetical protein